MVKTRSVGNGLKHQKEKRSMDHFGGLDVSVKETSVCIVDDTGRIVREVRVASEPEALDAAAIIAILIASPGAISTPGRRRKTRARIRTSLANSVLLVTA